MRVMVRVVLVLLVLVLLAHCLQAPKLTIVTSNVIGTYFANTIKQRSNKMILGGGGMHQKHQLLKQSSSTSQRIK